MYCINNKCSGEAAGGHGLSRLLGVAATVFWRFWRAAEWKKLFLWPLTLENNSPERFNYGQIIINYGPVESSLITMKSGQIIVTSRRDLAGIMVRIRGIIPICVYIYIYVLGGNI